MDMNERDELRNFVFDAVKKCGKPIKIELKENKVKHILIFNLDGTIEHQVKEP